MGVMTDRLSLFKDKRVLITGHTGFKGSWLSRIFAMAGAELAGYALPAEELSMYRLCKQDSILKSYEGDVRDFSHLRSIVNDFSPEYIFHLAAQPLVLEGYSYPRETYETNFMGTVNLLECIRRGRGFRSVVLITTDKVYREQKNACREDDALDGFDPYSNSKSCAELAAACYRRSFAMSVPISTARAGNTLGGGDFAANRILPDCMRALLKGETVQVRHPYSVRPYLYVLDTLCAYISIAVRQAEQIELAGAYNVAPGAEIIQTGVLVEKVCREWGEGRSSVSSMPDAWHETERLQLNNEKIRNSLHWRPHYSIDDAVRETVAWTKAWQCGEDMAIFTDRQIRAYLESAAK